MSSRERCSSPAAPSPATRRCRRAWLARADARSIAFVPEDSVRADVLRARRLMPNSADIRMAYAWSLFRSGATDAAFARRGARSRSTRWRPGSGTRSWRSPSARVATTLPCARCAVPIPGRRHRPGSRPSSRPTPSSFRAGPRECAAHGTRALGSRSAPCACHQLGRSAEATALADSLGRRAGRGALRLPAPVRRPRGLLCLAGRCGAVAHWLERAVAHSPMLHRWQLQSGLFDRVWRPAGVPDAASRGCGRWPKSGCGPAARRIGD